ncbi:MAG: MlaE family ABC transporter permease [Bacteroidales bacterium]
MLKILEIIGQYFLMLKDLFAKPLNFKFFGKQVWTEVESLGMRSLWLVVMISAFSGGVLTMQMAYNLDNEFLPKALIGLAARDSILLEFSSTILGLLLAGKIGSYITSQIGTMRVTEQIDALEVMGVNSIAHLILPKVVAVVFMFPLFNALSIIMGLFGGLVIGPLTGAITISDYVDGIRYLFNPYYVTFSFIKTVVYSLIIVTVSSYFGYYVKGGSVEVGNASTQAVVNSMMLIIIADLILTLLLMT